jgi:hypothetical protein
MCDLGRRGWGNPIQAGSSTSYRQTVRHGATLDVFRDFAA